MLKVIKNLYIKQITCLAIVCFFLFSGNLLARGLYLYSYLNNEGQRIIVSEENKVPTQYRDTLKKEFIKMFTSPKKAKTQKTEKPKIKLTSTSPNTNTQISIEPVSEVIDKTASASIWLTKLSSVQENNERLQMLALTQGRDVLEVKIRNSNNNNLLSEITKLNSLEWEGKERWTADANKLFRLLQNIQWSANQWMQSGNTGLIQNRSKLLKQARFELEKLKATFPHKTSKQ